MHFHTDSTDTAVESPRRSEVVAGVAVGESVVSLSLRRQSSEGGAICLIDLSDLRTVLELIQVVEFVSRVGDALGLEPVLQLLPFFVLDVVVGNVVQVPSLSLIPSEGSRIRNDSRIRETAQKQYSQTENAGGDDHHRKYDLCRGGVERTAPDGDSQTESSGGNNEEDGEANEVAISREEDGRGG
jgi:hypothetical protein